MLTGVAARLNEVKQRQNFSVKHFLGVAACGPNLLPLAVIVKGENKISVYACPIRFSTNHEGLSQLVMKIGKLGLHYCF